MYFASFPKIYYDSGGQGNLKLVTNLLKRVAIRSKVKSNTMLYDTYDVKNGESPESIADKLYDDPELHCICLHQLMFLMVLSIQTQIWELLQNRL